jgi:hypothetical protein
MTRLSIALLLGPALLTLSCTDPGAEVATRASAQSVATRTITIPAGLLVVSTRAATRPRAALLGAMTIEPRSRQVAVPCADGDVDIYRLTSGLRCDADGCAACADDSCGLPAFRPPTAGETRTLTLVGGGSQYLLVRRGLSSVRSFSDGLAFLQVDHATKVELPVGIDLSMARAIAFGSAPGGCGEPCTEGECNLQPMGRGFDPNYAEAFAAILECATDRNHCTSLDASAQ